MTEQTPRNLAQKAIDAAFEMPLGIRLALVASVLFPVSSIGVGFVGLLLYCLPSGLNFLNYLDAIDIANVGAAIILYWISPIIFLAGTIFLALAQASGMFFSKTESASLNQAGKIEAERRVGILRQAKLISVIFLLLLSLISWTALMAGLQSIPNNDRIQAENLVSGEIFLNARDFIVLWSGENLDYDPSSEASEDSRALPTLKIEFTIIPRSQIGGEYHYVRSVVPQEFDRDHPTISIFRSEDWSTPFSYRWLKAPFR